MVNEKIFLVKALTYFNATNSEEINLEPREVLQVIKKIDKFWYFGIKNDIKGKFPSSKVIELDISYELKSSIAVFICFQSVSNNNDKYLSLNKNDVIIATKKLNDNLFEGNILNSVKKGLFTTSNVWKVKELPIEETITSVAYATVIHDLEAKLDEEIDLHKGEIVKVLGEHDSMFYYGEINNRKGIFPKNFVSIMKNYQADICKENKQNDLIYNDNNYEIDNLPSYEAVTSGSWYNNLEKDISSYGRTLYPFVAENSNELSFEENQIINLIKYVDNNWIEGELDGKIGIFPKNYIEVIVDCSNALNFHQDSLEAEENYSDANLNIEEYAPGTQGKVLFDFEAQVDGDLSLKKGEVITLIRKFNDDWVEARNGLDLGSCPLNYIEVIEPQVSYFTNSFSTPDNLIEFSPEKKINQSDTDCTPQKVNYDVLHELEETYQPTVFKDEFSLNKSNERNIFNLSKVEDVFETSQYNQNYNSEFKAKTDVFSNIIEEKKLHNNFESKSETYSSSESKFQDFERIDNYETPKTKIIQSKKPLPETPKRPSPPVNLKNKEYNQKTIIKENKNDYNSAKTNIPLKPSTNLQKKNDLENNMSKNKLAKIAEQRMCIITELIQSEKDYSFTLQVCFDTFFMNEKLSLAFKELNIDLRMVFSNIDEIVVISKKLNKLLTDELKKDQNDQLIGNCFLSLEKEMNEVYGNHSRQYRDAIISFEKFSEDLEVNRLFKRGLEKIRSSTNCFDIPSILIKPVHRILKYPLLLNELIKCTSHENLDYEYLEKALKMITDMAKNLNEFEKQRDMLNNLKKEVDRNYSFSSKLSKINLHTLKKKYSRLNYKITSTIGLSNKSKDTDFDLEVNKFKSLEKSIKIFLKNLSNFIEKLNLYTKITFNLIEDIIILYENKSKQPLIEKSKECHYEMSKKLIEEFENKINLHVIEILKKLLEKFFNPEKLIEKRKNKLIDFDRANKNYQSLKDGSKIKFYKDEYDSAKEIYESLNQQLIQDLPKFTSLGAEIFLECIVAFITFFKSFNGSVFKNMLTLLTLPPIEGCKFSCSKDIVETFQVKHNLIAKKLVEDFHIVPNNIFPQINNSQALATSVLDKHKLMKNSKILNNSNTTKKKSNFQTQQNRLAILSNSTIDKNQIYIVQENFEPIDLYDLNALKDDIVVVIKTKDPTGSSTRWFVDNGNEKGFLPERILKHKEIESNQIYSSNYSTSNQSSNYLNWTSTSSNIYSEISDSGSLESNSLNHVEPDLLTIDDFDPIKQQQTYENINSIIDNEKDVNLLRDEPPVNEYYRAAYEFTPNGPKQLSLSINDIVVVKYKCDLKKDSEWWYVENQEGKCGYVPGNFLDIR